MLPFPLVGEASESCRESSGEAVPLRNEGALTMVDAGDAEFSSGVEDCSGVLFGWSDVAVKAGAKITSTPEVDGAVTAAAATTAGEENPSPD